MQSEDIISPVEFTEWVAPIVPVVKQDGSVHICGDYKCTVNQVSKLDNYPIPKTEDLLATLGGGNKFTKLDMSQAYQQLLLDEESKKFTTINTYKGLYPHMSNIHKQIPIVKKPSPMVPLVKNHHSSKNPYDSHHWYEWKAPQSIGIPL